MSKTNQPSVIIKLQYMKNAGIFLLILLILGGATAFIIYKKKGPTPKKSDTSAPPIIAQNETLTNWRTYENELGYRIKMPPNILVKTDIGEESVRLVPEKSSGEFGQPNYIYISVINRKNIEENNRIYNYNSEQFLKLMKMDIGSEQTIIPGQANIQGYKDWFMYKRLENTSINGVEARVFLNKKPWEFPLGVTEVRYIILTDNNVFILGAYFGGDVSYASLSWQDVKQIVSTFKIL